jgi:hypothetical protein
MKKSSKKSLTVFILAGLALSLALAFAISPFASSSPDGLEKVAGDKGFLERAEETTPAWQHAPISDYEFPGLAESHPAWATAIAGLSGTAAIFLLAWGLALVLRKKSSEAAPETETTDSRGG